jgi:Ser/Thr protein kinase RdoA (MazF antagonist)
MLGQVGTMMAMLHQHAEAYARSRAVHRHRETWHDLHIWTRGRDDVDHIYTPDKLALFGQAAEQALARIGALGEERDYGLVHADLHQYNYLFCGQDVRATDFDDCHFAPLAYDIAVTLWYLVGRPQFEAMREAFLGGYERVRPLPEGLEAQLAAFTLARQLSMMQWVLSWPSPTLLPWGSRFLKHAPIAVQHHLDRL